VCLGLRDRRKKQAMRRELYDSFCYIAVVSGRIRNATNLIRSKVLEADAMLVLLCINW
jgi:hypothetical protein